MTIADFKFNLTGGKDNDGNDVVAHVRFDDECRNGHQSFAITGSVYEAGKPHTERNMISCGCVHEPVAEAYPQLAEFIRWHLTSTDGPMHYAANGAYFARKAMGVYRVFKHYDFEAPNDSDWDTFRSTVVFGAVEGDDDSSLREAIPVAPPEGVIWEQYDRSDDAKALQAQILGDKVTEWCKAREAGVVVAFMADMERVQELRRVS